MPWAFILAASAVAYFAFRKKGASGAAAATPSGGGTKESLFDESWPSAWGDVLPSEWKLPDSWTSTDVFSGDVFGLKPNLMVPKSIPEATSVRETGGGAESPIQPGERVVFDVQHSIGGGTDLLATLEGTWGGPADVDSMEGTVYVDRIALKDTGSELIAFGKYTVPASKKNGWHTYVERVTWTAQDPKSMGLSSFATTPVVKPGDKVTALLRDASGTSVIAIAIVQVVKGADLVIAPVSVYRVLKDEGAGEIVLPKHPSQISTTIPRGWLVDPKSIPALTKA